MAIEREDIMNFTVTIIFLLPIFVMRSNQVKFA